MPSILTGEPFRGWAEVELDEGAGIRRWRVSATVGGVRGDQPTWTGTAGGSLTLEAAWVTSGTPTHGQADTFIVYAAIPGGAAIGSTWTVPISGNNGTATRTLHFDEDPLNAVAGAVRAGMLELIVRVKRTATVSWGTGGDPNTDGLNSRGDNTAMRPSSVLDGNYRFARGYVRAPITLASEGLSNVAAGGAEPATWAYPDPFHGRAVADAVTYRATTMSLDVAGLRTKSTASGTATTRDAALTAASERLDAAFSAGAKAVKWTIPALDSWPTTNGGNPTGGDPEMVWAASGHPAGWVRDSDATLRHPTRATVDPAVTLSALTITAPETTATVYNRGETCAGSVERRNARGEAFAPLGTERLRTVDVGTSAVEQTLATPTRTGARLDWSATWATAGNVAPATSAGAAKKLRWDDLGATTSPSADTGQVGLLSSLYDLERHLQLNNNALDPGLATDRRLTSDLGFYSVRVLNRRGAAVNGAQGVLSLRDDSDLTTAVTSATLTTATVNGHAGWVPLQPWDSQLPGGAWDLWASTAFAKDGNATPTARTGAGSGDFTLLAVNPSYITVAGGGPQADEAEHAAVGRSFRAGASIVDGSTGLRVPATSAKLALIRLQNGGATAGFAEYLSADRTTWVPMDDAPGGADTDAVHFFTAAETRPNAGVFIVDFSAADTAAWGSSLDVFVLAVLVDASGTPYGNYIQVPVVGDANGHGGYRLDPLALTQGVLSFR